MNRKKAYPDWFLWMWEHGLLVFLGGLLLFIGTTIGLVLHFESRLEQVEDRLLHAPPASYQAPRLDDYPIGQTDPSQLPVGRLVYVPVYSHVYYQGGRPYLLETMLSIRNTDVDHPLYLVAVDYFDTSGKLVRRHLGQAIKLGPLQTIEFLVETRDSSGGSGANFLVEWRAEVATLKPIVEAVMVGTAGTQGISFARSGIEIKETRGGRDVGN